MTLHRKRRPYSPAYARRQLVSVQQALASLRLLEVGSDWRKATSKAENLRRLECLERKWQRVLNPPPLEQLYVLPF